MYPEVEDWLETYGFMGRNEVNELPEFDYDSGLRWGYHVPDYVGNGYTLTQLASNFVSSEWAEIYDPDDEVYSYTHTRYHTGYTTQVKAVIEVDGDFWFFLPKFSAARPWLDGVESNFRGEFYANLIAGPPGEPDLRRNHDTGQDELTFSPAVVDMDYLMDWLFNPKHITQSQYYRRKRP